MRSSRSQRLTPAKPKLPDSSPLDTGYPMCRRCLFSLTMLESRWPTETSLCPAWTLKISRPKSKSTLKRSRRFLRDKSHRYVHSGKGQAPSALRALPAWPSAEAKRWVFNFAKKICADKNTQALVVIGSMARPVPSVQDVDLLYIYKSHRPEFAEHPMDVDVRVYDGREVPALIAAGHDLLCWALRYGRVLCEQNHYWTQLATQWKDHSPLPDPVIAERRASKAEAFYHDFHRLGDLDAACEQLVSLLTHKAWARLLRAGIYPASRPELAEQLRILGDTSLAEKLEMALAQRRVEMNSAGQRHVSSTGGSRPR
jgi:hypothetical protein